MQRHLNGRLRSAQNDRVNLEVEDDNKGRSLLRMSLQSPVRRPRLAVNSPASDRVLMNVTSSLPIAEDESIQSRAESSTTMYTDGQDVSSARGDEADSVSEGDYFDELVSNYRMSMNTKEASLLVNGGESKVKNVDEGSFVKQQSVTSIVSDYEGTTNKSMQQPKDFLKDERTTSFEEGLYSSSEDSKHEEDGDVIIPETGNKITQDEDLLPLDVHAVSESLERLESGKSRIDVSREAGEDSRKSLRFIKYAVQGLSPAQADKGAKDEEILATDLPKREHPSKPSRALSFQSSKPEDADTLIDARPSQQNCGWFRPATKAGKYFIFCVVLISIVGVVVVVFLVLKESRTDSNSIIATTSAPSPTTSRIPTVRKTKIPTQILGPSIFPVDSLIPSFAKGSSVPTNVPSVSPSVNVVPSQLPSAGSPSEAKSVEPTISCLDETGAVFVNNTVRTCQSIANRTSQEIRIWCQFETVNTTCIRTCDNCRSS